MISREQVIDLYRLILEREPESEGVITEKRNASNVVKAAVEMLKSDEFFNRNRELLRAYVSPTSEAPD